MGGVVRARAIAKRVECDLAIIDKRRKKAGISEVMNIIGDVNNKNCILIDDMCDTAGTLTNAAKALKEAGSESVNAYITHGVFSNPAIERINNSPIDKMIITDSILPTKEVLESNKIESFNLIEHEPKKFLLNHKNEYQRLFSILKKWLEENSQKTDKQYQFWVDEKLYKNYEGFDNTLISKVRD